MSGVKVPHHEMGALEPVHPPPGAPQLHVPKERLFPGLRNTFPQSSRSDQLEPGPGGFEVDIGDVERRTGWVQSVSDHHPRAPRELKSVAIHLHDFSDLETADQAKTATRVHVPTRELPKAPGQTSPAFLDGHNMGFPVRNQAQGTNEEGLPSSGVEAHNTDIPLGIFLDQEGAPCGTKSHHRPNHDEAGHYHERKRGAVPEEGCRDQPKEGKGKDPPGAEEEKGSGPPAVTETPEGQSSQEDECQVPYDPDP